MRWDTAACKSAAIAFAENKGEGERVFYSFFLVVVDSVEVREISGKTVIVFQQEQAEDSRIATIILRASTDNVLEDLERAVDDGIHTVRAACFDPRFVAGAGAVELELTKQLRAYAESVAGLDQYAIRKVRPKWLLW